MDTRHARRADEAARRGWQVAAPALKQRLGRADGAATDLFPELKRKLLAHAHAEEETFYPELRRFAELEELVARCVSDHREVERQLEERYERIEEREKSALE